MWGWSSSFLPQGIHAGSQHSAGSGDQPGLPMRRFCPRFENSIYLLWVAIVTGGSHVAPAAWLGDSLHCGITCWFHLHPWKMQEFLGPWVGSARDAPFPPGTLQQPAGCPCSAVTDFQSPITGFAFLGGATVVFPAQSLSRHCI